MRFEEERDRIRRIYEQRFFAAREPETQLPDDDPQWVLLRAAARACATPDPAVLDAGCGGGRYARALVRAGLGTVEGVDLFDSVPGLVPGIIYRQGSIDALPEDAASFDLGYSMSVIHYLDDPRPGLRELGRVLRPGGLLLFTAHTRYSLYTLARRLRRALDWPGWDHLHGLHFHSLFDYRRALGDTGFELLQVGGWSWPAFLRVWPDSIVPPGTAPPTIPDRALLLAETYYHSVVLARKRTIIGEAHTCSP